MLNSFPLNTAALNGISGEVPPPPPRGLIHRATDIHWQAQTLEVNTVVVYGETAEGTLVSGQASDREEVEGVGYRLEITREPSIPTAELCAWVAAATIEKMRLNKLTGGLSALPNCALELFDVVQVTDRWTGLEKATFRVTAISLSYDCTRGTIGQRLALAAL